ncbi:MAG: hypothetical protein FJ126_01345 [Deltaproteobacteria bacterium]|nr:hypothetical protein [Deltaproteobacteria bacterium]MBM4293537.1 hypothetical protein [Deltaproteobacteria bacterium]
MNKKQKAIISIFIPFIIILTALFISIPSHSGKWSGDDWKEIIITLILSIIIIVILELWLHSEKKVYIHTKIIDKKISNGWIFGLCGNCNKFTPYEQCDLFGYIFLSWLNFIAVKKIFICQHCGIFIRGNPAKHKYLGIMELLIAPIIFYYTIYFVYQIGQSGIPAGKDAIFFYFFLLLIYLLITIFLFTIFLFRDGLIRLYFSYKY